jgi:hypothetical protein
VLKAICLVVILIILVTGLWPFNFVPRNEVEWLRDGSGVRFYGQGMIISADDWNDEQKPLFPDKSITLEFMLRPAMETGNAPSILTLYDEDTQDIFAVRQWRSHMVIWSRADDPAFRKRGKSYQEMGFRDVLQKDRDVFIAVTSGNEGSALYLNGLLLKRYPDKRLIAGNPSGNIRLIIGNSPNGHSYWTGDFLGLAIYDRVLTPDQVFSDYRAWTNGNPAAVAANDGYLGIFPFHEKAGTSIHNLVNPRLSLTIPVTFAPPKRTILDLPWRDFVWNWSLAQDLSINILGFIPFGFFLACLLKRTNRLKKSAIFLIVAAAGTVISLGIELMQGYLPTRSSQLIDVFCNAAGTISGLLFITLRKNWTGQYRDQ